MVDLESCLNLPPRTTFLMIKKENLILKDVEMDQKHCFTHLSCKNKSQSQD